MDIKVFNEIAPAVNQVEVNPFQQQIDSAALMPKSWACSPSLGPVRRGATTCLRTKC